MTKVARKKILTKSKRFLIYFHVCKLWIVWNRFMLIIILILQKYWFWGYSNLVAIQSNKIWIFTVFKKLWVKTFLLLFSKISAIFTCHEMNIIALTIIAAIPVSGDKNTLTISPAEKQDSSTFKKKKKEVSWVWH